MNHLTIEKADKKNEIICYLNGKKAVFNVRLVFRKIQGLLRIGGRLRMDKKDKDIYVSCSGIRCNDCPFSYHIAEVLDTIKTNVYSKVAATGYASNNNYERFTCADYTRYVLNSPSIKRILLYMGMIDASTI